MAVIAAQNIVINNKYLKFKDLIYNNVVYIINEIQVICKASGAIQIEWNTNWNEDNNKTDAKIAQVGFIIILQARNKTGADKKVNKQK